MTFDLTLFALFQLSGALWMVRRIRKYREQRLRISIALKGWIESGDVYFNLGEGR